MQEAGDHFDAGKMSGNQQDPLPSLQGIAKILQAAYLTVSQQCLSADSMHDQGINMAGHSIQYAHS
jgi:hypothetical protein